MAKEEKPEMIKPQVIIVRLREGSTVAERLADTVIGMLGGIVALLGALIFVRAM